MSQIFNVGDKVRFLNDVGDGKVTGFRKGGIVLVEDADGFETPVLESDICLISSSEKKLTKAYAEPQREEPAEQPVYHARTILATAASRRGYVEEEDGMDTQSRGVHQTVSSSSASSLSAVASSSSSSSRGTSPSYTEELEQRVLRLEMTVTKLIRRIERLEDAKALREKIKESDLKLREENRRKKDDIIEVDLHADEILDTTVNMSAADIKDYQLKVFRDTMDAHLKEKNRRIVFIHGNGEGVLRRAILDELRRSYKSCEYQDASFQQYGFGATMVIIH